MEMLVEKQQLLDVWGHNICLKVTYHFIFFKSKL